MQDQAIEVSQDAMEKYTIEKDIAQYIKKEVSIAQKPFTFVKKSKSVMLILYG